LAAKLDAAPRVSFDIMSTLAARPLLLHKFMQAKSHIKMRVGLLLTDPGYFLARTGYRKAAIMIIAVVFLMILVITQFGKAAKIEKGAEVAFSRARQLLHEADKENRNLRPLPLSVAQVEPLGRLT
jgi:hypothetical protein